VNGIARFGCLGGSVEERLDLIDPLARIAVPDVDERPRVSCIESR